VKTRLIASVALAGALLLGTSACTLFSVQGTLVQYEPSDGTAATVGDVKVRNLIGLSDNGDDISLLMTIINGGTTSASVNFQYENASGEQMTLTVDVPANSSVNVGSGGDAEEAVMREVGATVGGLVPVYVQYGKEPGKQVQVPVLDGANDAYAGLLPSPLPAVTPTPTPTATETAIPAS
jgi:hypothetical protein